jgi:hypothetical protein
MIDEDPIVDDSEIDTNLNNIDNGDEEFKRISKTYRSVELKKWRPAPVVRENPGKPGEMGKPVKMKSYQQEEMKEKFKENQFNLLASDMIWLNRSLADVRHKELSLRQVFSYRHVSYRILFLIPVVDQKRIQPSCQQHRLLLCSIMKRGRRF